MKKYVWRFITLIIMLSFITITSYADQSSLRKVEGVISGNQDKLILGTIVSISSNVYTVEVMDEIGADVSEDSEESEELSGKRIEISRFNSYMYYDSIDYHPKKGDNVLLSLTFKGNEWYIKNGAYRISSASYENFRFIVPDVIDETQEAMELTALHFYVLSGGKNADYEVRDGLVYTHDINKNEKVITTQQGIEFINEYGETTKNTENVAQIYDGNSMEYKHAWKIALLILIFGAFTGVGGVKLINKFKKRSED